MQRRSQGTVNPEAKTCVRIVCQEGSWSSQLMGQSVHVNSRIASDQGHGRKALSALKQKMKGCQQGPMRQLPGIIGSGFDDSGTFSSLMLLIYVGSHAGHTMKTGNVYYLKNNHWLIGQDSTFW